MTYLLRFGYASVGLDVPTLGGGEDINGTDIVPIGTLQCMNQCGGTK